MPGRPDVPRWRERRRAERRSRQARRRRALVVGALVVGIGAVAIVLALTGGGGNPAPAPVTQAAASTSRATHGARGGSPTPHATPREHRGESATSRRDVAPPARAPEPALDSSAPPGQAIPILMYHVVEAAPAGTPYPDLWVSADTFRAELAMLRAKGYHAITMRDADDYWRHGRRVPRKPIVLTFDDGYRSQAEVARPALARLGWPGVLYLQVSALKTPGAEGISRRAIRSLIAAGWEIGAHTITHPDLTTLPGAALREEVAGSRRMIHAIFGDPVDAFAYPAGRYDAAVEAAVRDAGFRTAVTVEEGAAKPGDRFALPRIRVHASDTPDTLATRLAAAGG